MSPAERADAVCGSLRALADPGLSIGRPEAVEERDWSEAWKEGLTATVISPRLAVRPESVVLDPVPGQRVLVIPPGQAFGTGGHASTRLALEWIDRVAPSLTPGARVLDVGTGSGVLSLAALALGPCTAVAFDLDPLAARAALENARRNGLDERIHVFTGPLAALAGQDFELVVANLLRSELLPIAGEIAAATGPGGQAIFAGLLATDCEQVEAALAGVGLRVRDVRHLLDANGEQWAGLLTMR